jgi:putative membrane protein
MELPISQPTLNAILNASSSIFMTIGYFYIRQKNRTAHRNCMIGAITSSTLFLISYLIYHATHGATKFAGQGLVRPVYFIVLFTHTVLAAVALPLVIRTFYLGWKDELSRHKKIAKWTFPIWLYVSVTGVVVYFMLYHLYPTN